MTREETWTRLRKVIGDVFEDENVVLEPTSTAADVEGWDSVSNIELLVALEKEFGIRFNTGEMASLDNIGQLMERIIGSPRSLNSRG